MGSARMVWRRFLPNIRYGMEGYPEKVARRLRATNFAAWLAAAALAGVAAGLIIFLHAIAPYDPGLLPESASLLGSIAVNVVANTVILFVIVFYALRHAARSESAAEREHARSESLLANILSSEVAARLKDGGAAEGTMRTWRLLGPRPRTHGERGTEGPPAAARTGAQDGAPSY
jgi:hypothetical protein